MFKKRDRNEVRVIRHARVRKKISGTPEMPRLCVYRSNKSIYAQVIDDTKGQTLVSASTIDPAIRGQLDEQTKTGAAQMVGKLVAERALNAGIKDVVFDRGGYLYTGRVAALAAAALKQARGTQGTRKLFEVLDGDALALAYLAQGDTALTLMAGDVDHHAHAVATPGGNKHGECLLVGESLGLAQGDGKLVSARGGAVATGIAGNLANDLVNRCALHELGDGLEVAVASIGELNGLDGLAVVGKNDVDVAGTHALRGEVGLDHGCSPSHIGSARPQGRDTVWVIVPAKRRA